MYCKDSNCTDHIIEIKSFYNQIVSAIKLATQKCIPTTKSSANEYVKEPHDIARDALHWWTFNNRPRYGPIYHSMRTSRAQFKYALRYAKSIEETARADSLASDFFDENIDDFWFSVRRSTQSSTILSNCIDDVSGEVDISNLWKEHFELILNGGICNAQLKQSVVGKLQGIKYDENMLASSEDIRDIVNKLKCGKSSGPDVISAESLKFSPSRLYVLLSLCFSLCLTHGYLPKSLMETTIVPIVKSKCGNLSDSNNYRPIAIATITSKVLESLTLVKCEEFLYTSDNHFGFKSCHSTEFCIYTLQEYIEFYKRRNTTVFVTFLDASKAFDQIDHWRLFTKLIDKHVPLFAIKLLVFWYSQQQMNIRWGNTVSSSFHVTNGVKQGGIISPVLFNVCMDDLSTSLNNSGIGGHIVKKL